MESIFLKWMPEITYNIWFLFIVACLAAMIKTIGKRINILEEEKGRRPKMSYVAKRLQISKYLEELVEDANGGLVTRMQWIRDLSSKIVAGNLKKDFPAFIRTCKKTQALEKKLTDELEVLYDTIFRGHDRHLKQKQQFYRAFAFELKNRIVRNPFDIQNHRRCYVIESLFNDIWSKNNPTKIQKLMASFRTICPPACLFNCFGYGANAFKWLWRQGSTCWTELKEKSCGCWSKLREKVNTCSCWTKMKEKTSASVCWNKIKEKVSACASYCSACCPISRIAKSFTDCWKSLGSGVPAKYGKIEISKVLVSVVILQVGLICYDYYTDITVCMVFGTLAFSFIQTSNFSALENDTTKNETVKTLFGKIVSAIPVTNESSSHEAQSGIPEPGMIGYFLICILLMSTLLLLFDNPLKLLARQVKTSLRLDSATVEESGEEITWQSIIHRYQLPIEEAGFEAGFQVAYQWGAYFSICLLLSMLRAVEGTLDTDGISTLDSQLKFETLKLSGLGSIASLSLAQLKANFVQNELNSSFLQKWLLYFPACLLNALSSVMLNVGLVTAGLDFFYFSSVIQTRWLVVCMQFLGVVIIFCVLPLARWMTTKLRPPPKSNILPAKADTYTSLLQALQLPTSQSTIRGKGYLSYHTSTFHSPGLLRLIQIQFLAYILLLIPTVALNIATSVLIEFNPTMIALSQTTNLTDFTSYSVSLARRNLMINSSYGIPVGVLMSYVFLTLYFKCDNGFFSVANIEFDYKGKDKTSSASDVENSVTNTCEAMELEQTDEIDEGNRASTNEDNSGTDQREINSERPPVLDQDVDGDTETQCCIHKCFGRSGCCKSQETPRTRTRTRTPVTEQIAGNSERDPMMNHDMDGDTETHGCRRTCFGSCSCCDSQDPSWFDKSVEDDSKNPWHLRNYFGLPCCKPAVIPNDSFNGDWMDLGGNNTDSESDEDTIEDSEILNRVKSSFYYYKNINDDEEETPV